MIGQPRIRMDSQAPLRLAPLGPAAFLVYAYLCMRSDDAGLAWPSIPRIAKDLCIGEATVKRALQALAEAREVRRQPRPGKVTIYRITPSSNQTRVPSSDQARVEHDPAQTKPGTQAQNELGPSSNQAYEPNTRTIFKNQEPSPAETNERFEEFWSNYPTPKSGRKVGRGAALKLFADLKPADQRLAIQAAQSYGGTERGQEYTRDPDRFLADGFWRDWLPSDGESVNQPRKGPPVFAVGRKEAHSGDIQRA